MKTLWRISRALYEQKVLNEISFDDQITINENCLKSRHLLYDLKMATFSGMMLYDGKRSINSKPIKTIVFLSNLSFLLNSQKSILFYKSNETKSISERRGKYFVGQVWFNK